MKILLTTAACALVLSASALASQGRGGADADRDGVITRAEAVAAAEERFDRTDENGDDYISEGERDAAAAALRERMEERRAEGRHFGRRGKGGERSMGQQGAFFAQADTDDDGFVSKQEAVSHALDRFDRLDADEDGTVTRDEMRAAFEKKRGDGERRSRWR